MKKLLLTLGSLTATVIPVAVVVACGPDFNSGDKSNIDKNTNGDVDLSSTIESAKKEIYDMGHPVFDSSHDYDIYKNVVSTYEEVKNKYNEFDGAQTLKDVERIKNEIMGPLHSVFDLYLNSHPTTTQPTTPAVQQPITPAVQQPTTPAVQQPITPVVQQPTTPAVQQPTTPAVQQPGLDATHSGDKNWGTPTGSSAGGTLQPVTEHKHVINLEQVETVTLPAADSTQINDVISSLSSSQNTVIADIGAANKPYYNLPKKIVLSGNRNAALLPNLHIGDGVTLEYYKKVAALNEMHQTRYALQRLTVGTPFTILSTDRIVAIVKKGNDYVNGKIYNPLFDKLTSTLTNFADGGFGTKIRNGNMTIDDIINFVDTKLIPGRTYTSSLSGDTKSVTMPELDAKDRPMDAKPGSEGSKIFSPFIDASMAQGNFDDDEAQMDYIAKRYSSITMAFLQNDTAKGAGLVTGAWGGNVGLKGQTTDKTAARDGASYYQLMQKMRENGHDFIVSFGGASGSPIWDDTDPILLAGFLVNFADEFNVTTFDYDIEGGAVNNVKGVKTIALATSIAQKVLAKRNRRLKINLTLPAEWNGLADVGQNALTMFTEAGVEINVLNGMAMMMNAGKVAESGGLPGVYDKHTIDGLKAQLKTSYAAVNLDIPDKVLYDKLGVTFDISTDTWDNEQMTNAQIPELLKVVKDKGIGFLGYWSLNNDEAAINGMGAPHQFDVGKAYEVLQPFADNTGAIPRVYSEKQNEDTLVRFKEFYKKAILSGTDSSSAEVILPETTTGNIQGGSKIRYKNPDDNQFHIYLAKWFAGPSERPHNTKQSGQFVDLGLEADASQDISPEFKTLMAKFSPFSMLGDEAAISQQIDRLFTNDSLNILPYKSDIAYPGHSIVLYNGKIYTDSYYENKGTLGKSPTASWYAMEVI